MKNMEFFRIRYRGLISPGEYIAFHIWKVLYPNVVMRCHIRFFNLENEKEFPLKSCRILTVNGV